MLDFRSIAKHALEKHADKTALVVNAEAISYENFDQLIDQHAACLKAHQLSKGDRVALMSCNNQDLAALFFAVWRIGCIAVPLNHLYKAPEVEYALKRCNVRLAIIQDQIAAGLAGRFKCPECTEYCYTFDNAIEEVGSPWRERVFETNEIAFKADPPKGGEPAVIFFTSGSTSKPKGVIHTAQSIIDTGESRAATMNLKDDDIWILSTQLVHVSASLGSLIPAIIVGGTAVLLERFSSSDWLDSCNKYIPTRSVILPSLLHDILMDTASESIDFSGFRSMECVGDYVTPHLYSAWKQVSDQPLNQVIGMTECEGYAFRHPGEQVKQGSAGRPRLGVEVSIRDSEGSELPAGQVGELCIRSSSMTIGYWEDPEHTQETIRNGWLHSGDQGRIDEEGYIWFVGRFKEIIVKRGANIAPGEVESVLDNHPLISETAVVGTPPGLHGQQVVAFVECEEGKTIDLDSLKQWTTSHIADFKVPDEWIVVDVLPRNAVGKLDRAELHQRVKKLFPGRV